jgi:hypothetical protein
MPATAVMSLYYEGFSSPQLGATAAWPSGRTRINHLVDATRPPK